MPAFSNVNEIKVEFSEFDYDFYIDSMKSTLTENELLTLQQDNNLVKNWYDIGFRDISAYYFKNTLDDRSKSSEWMLSGDKFQVAFAEADNTVLIRFYVDNAIYCYEKAFELDPGNTAARIRLATCFIDGTKEVMRAVRLLKDILIEEPGNFDANYYLGILSMHSAQYDKAIMRFETALETEPHSIDAWLNLGEAYVKTGNGQKAKEVLLECKSLIEDPEIIQMLDNYIDAIEIN